MSKAQYDIYLGKVMDLAKTLVVKSQASADSINKQLLALGYAVNDTDPGSWKYYLNLNGRYHPYDRMMTIRSLDTLQTIDFTRENLQEHRATYREYAFGSRYYNDLVSRYPEQENLIRGILNPVEIDVAVRAPDGRVLYYDPALVESNETNLIPNLSQWTEDFMVRWDVAAYGIVDELYPAGQQFVMYQTLPTQILNLRLANCHTPYTHSYHIREFLASNGRLDVFVDYLTKRQMLWLYRNIRYLHRNAGKRETFVTLVKHILTDRGLPLAEWNMRHNIRDQVAEIYPDIEFSRTPLNFGFNNTGSDTRSVAAMLTEEQQVARGNARVQAEAETQITRQMENSITNKLRTKVLESSVLDLTDASFFTLSDCLLNHWLYLASVGRYNAACVVDNPKTGDALTLTMRDAFVVFLYCYNKARGMPLEQIPLIEAIHVRREPVPTLNAIRRLAERRLVPTSLLQQAKDLMTPLGTYISIISFHESMVQVHRQLLRHRDMWTSQEHMEARVQVESALSSMYCDIKCDLNAGMSYADWFQEKGLDIPTFNELEADLLANEILATATGANLKVVQSLKEMQGAMLRLMTQLSSYSVQYLQSINTLPVQVVEWPAVRVGDQNVKGKDRVQWDLINVRVQDLHARAKVHDMADLCEIGLRMDPSVKMHHKDGYDPTVQYTDNTRDKVYVRVDTAPVRVLNITETLDNVPTLPDLWTEHYVPIGFQGLEPAFQTLISPMYVLTDEDRQILRDRWEQWLLDHGSGKLPLDSVLTVDPLPALVYPETIDIRNTVLPGFDVPVVPVFRQNLPGFNDPQTRLELDGFDLAPLEDPRVNLDGFDDPDLNDTTP